MVESANGLLRRKLYGHWQLTGGDRGGGTRWGVVGEASARGEGPDPLSKSCKTVRRSLSGEAPASEWGGGGGGFAYAGGAGATPTRTTNKWEENGSNYQPLEVGMGLECKIGEKRGQYTVHLVEPCLIGTVLRLLHMYPLNTTIQTHAILCREPDTHYSFNFRHLLQTVYQSLSSSI